MKVEYLSDHVGDLIRESQRKLTLLNDEQAYWRSAIREAEYDLVVVRGRRRFWQRLFNIASPEEPILQQVIVEAEHSLRSLNAGLRELESEIGAREGGAEGERRFEGELKWMADDWRMFRGYRNQSGEADAVLVGPDGVWTVEVKNWKARLRIDGDNWSSRDVFDGSKQSATDRKGRSPARQVREIAESLATRLHRVGHVVPVRTGVVVLNKYAEIESCRRPDVDFVGTSTSEFADRMTELATPLDADEVVSIQRHVRRDHHFWERRSKIRRA